MQFPRQFAPWFNEETRKDRGQTETDMELKQTGHLLHTRSGLQLPKSASNRAADGRRRSIQLDERDGRYGVANTLCRTASWSRHYWIRSWVQSWATNENWGRRRLPMIGHWKGADGATNSHAESSF